MNYEIENLLTCKICQDIVLLPVRMKFQCCSNNEHLHKCDYVVCLKCARLLLELDKPKYKRKEKIYCIICRKSCLYPKKNKCFYSIYKR